MLNAVRRATRGLSHPIADCVGRPLRPVSTQDHPRRCTTFFTDTTSSAASPGVSVSVLSWSPVADSNGQHPRALPERSVRGTPGAADQAARSGGRNPLVSKAGQSSLGSRTVSSSGCSEVDPDIVRRATAVSHAFRPPLRGWPSIRPRTEGQSGTRRCHYHRSFVIQATCRSGVHPLALLTSGRRAALVGIRCRSGV